MSDYTRIARALLGVLLTAQFGLALAQGPCPESPPVTHVGELGLTVVDIPNPSLDEREITYGVAIVGVIADSVAIGAGIRTGDVIYKLNGLPVYSTDRLQWLVGHSTPTEVYRLSVLRGQDHLEFEIAPPDP